MSPAEIAAHLIAVQVIQYRVPIYFIAEEFARAVAATDLPHDLTVDDLHWPMPGMVLGFPPWFMQDYLGTEVCFVNAANFVAGLHSAPEALGGTQIEVLRPNVAWQCHMWHDHQIKAKVASDFKEGAVDAAVGTIRIWLTTG